MKLVYIAGAYRGDSMNAVWNNIAHARSWAEVVAQKGEFPVCPHMNTAFMDGIQSDEFWLEGTLELLKKCDSILMIPGWQESSGAKMELAVATERGMEINFALS